MRGSRGGEGRRARGAAEAAARSARPRRTTRVRRKERGRRRATRNGAPVSYPKTLLASAARVGAALLFFGAALLFGRKRERTSPRSPRGQGVKGGRGSDALPARVAARWPACHSCSDSCGNASHVRGAQLCGSELERLLRWRPRGSLCEAIPRYCRSRGREGVSRRRGPKSKVTNQEDSTVFETFNAGRTCCVTPEARNPLSLSNPGLPWWNRCCWSALDPSLAAHELIRMIETESYCHSERTYYWESVRIKDIPNIKHNNI